MSEQKLFMGKERKGYIPVIKDLLEYEKKLLADREQLLRLTEQYQGEDDELILDKLDLFQNELTHMNRQYNILKKRVELETKQSLEFATDSQRTQPVQPEIEFGQAGQIHFDTSGQILSESELHQAEQILAEPVVELTKQSESSSASQPTQQTTQTRQTSQTQHAQQIQPVQNTQPTQKKSKNLEKTVGTAFMGILASGLIFISLILFATIVLPYMGNAVKLFSCYLISFIIIGVSLIKLRKDKDNKFYLALSGCGVGALYISLLLTNIYFRYIGDITLFVLITLWVAFICYLSKVKNKVFHTIGQLGITVSIIFGSVLCAETGDMLKFVFLTIFYIVAFGALFIMHFEKEVADTKIGNTFGFINLLIIFFSSLIVFDNYNSPYYLLMVMITLVHLIALFMGSWERTKVSYGLFTSFYAFVLCQFVTSLLLYEELFGFVNYILSMAVLFLVEFKPKNYQYGKIVAQIALLIQTWVFLSMNPIILEHGFVWLLVLPAIILGFMCKNKICQYAGLIFLFFYFMEDVQIVEKFFTGLITIVAIHGILVWKKEQRTFAYKTWLHLVSILFLLTIFSDFIMELVNDYDVKEGLTYILIAVFNVAMAKSTFGKNPLTKEPENKVCYNIINMILMLAGLVQISTNTVLHIPIILVTLVVFLMNSKNLLDRHQHVLVGIYVGFKFTLLLIVIMNSFDAINYVISSACILFAIACIVLGFVKEYKSLRIYGLILSMISVFKLIMVDLRYENTLGNAVSFFVSGVLCFAISMIYNYIDKKMVEEKEMEE